MTVVKLRNNADTGLVLDRKCKVRLPDRKLLWNNTCRFAATETPAWGEIWAHKNLWPVHRRVWRRSTRERCGVPVFYVVYPFLYIQMTFRWPVFWWVGMTAGTGTGMGGSQTTQGSPVLGPTCIREHVWLNRRDLYESMETVLIASHVSPIRLVF